eukprot:Gregarina_sp_Poly_1__9422@NODE_58_length_17191_cov_34_446508_g49_i0_p3_GENE_NODE_58_length_17191_cov_34_446508_g49_i0NODE_58_length_17191_cov_34_446508_g49_i0_p3_ORF_typecomplete_len512_score78_70DUF1080/PF06439_11/3_8e02DUF1080/PF06439_11/0_45_NODE_58_length_17191_cov_34_446508_g49_i024123947
MKQDNFDNVNILEEEIRAEEESQFNSYLNPTNLLYTDLGASENIHRDFAIWDSYESSLGPSAWSISAAQQKLTEEAGSLFQRSPIFAPNSSGLGTILLFTKSLYSAGFAVFRVRLSGGGLYGTFGFVFGFIDERNFYWLEITRPSVNPKSLYIQFKELHLGRTYDLSSGASCDKISAEPSQWLIVGVDFGPSSARAFLDGSKCSDGFIMRQTQKAKSNFRFVLLGHLGLFTNSLAVKTSAEFSTVTFGPLSAQIEYGRIAFGEAIAREVETTAEVQERSKELRTEIANAKAEVTVEPLPTAADEGLNLGQTADETANMNGVLNLGQDGNCYENYTQKMYGGQLEDFWDLPLNKEEASWSLATGRIIAAVQGNNPALASVSKPMCNNKAITRLEASLKLRKNSIGGVVWRIQSNRDFYASTLDSTSGIRNTYSQASVVTVGGRGEVVQTNSATLIEDWANITILDSGTKIIIHTNGRLSHELPTRPLIDRFRVGLLLLRGGFSIRSFKVDMR